MSYYDKWVASDWWYYDECQLRKWLRGEEVELKCTSLNVEYLRNFNEVVSELKGARHKMNVCAALFDELVQREQDKRYRSIYRCLKKHMLSMDKSLTKEIKLANAIREKLKIYSVQDPATKRLLTSVLNSLHAISCSNKSANVISK